MVKREDVEALLATCEQIYKPNNGVIAECCRAWLALDAAPEVEVKECCSHAIIGSDWDDDPTGFNYCGQRVRLVGTPASGGPRDA